MAQEVYNLADEGLEPEDIALELGAPLGVVVAELRERRGSSVATLEVGDEADIEPDVVVPPAGAAPLPVEPSSFPAGWQRVALGVQFRSEIVFPGEALEAERRAGRRERSMLRW